MPTSYVPILKCKKGEQNALSQLTPGVKANIKPLLEIPFTDASTKYPMNEFIQSFWSTNPFFFYFLPEWYDESMECFAEFISLNVESLIANTAGTPVFDLSSLDYIEDWNSIKKNGIAIRLRNNELGEVTTILNPLFSSGKIARKETDLILDLQNISANDLFTTRSVLKTVLSELTNANEYHSIIIASASFPKPTPAMETDKIYCFERIEKQIHEFAIELAKDYNFNYIYSDYGTSDNEDVTFVLGMSPNFKIKYSTWEKYLYIKSYSLKKGGLDIQNVQRLTKLLVDSSYFFGAEYSWGDNSIDQIAKKQSLSPGNLTTWVSYSMNHHITLISKNL